MDTNNIKSLNRLPEGVTVTSEGLISCTRDALNHLGNWCKKNAGALAISVFATTGVNAALAGTPAHTTDAQSPSATLQATKGYGQTVTLKDGSQMTFVALQKMTDTQKKDEIVNGLSRTDKIKFKEFELQTTNQEIKSIDSDIKTANQTKEIKLNTLQTTNQTKESKRESLIKGYYIYVANAENGAPAKRAIIQKIANLADPKDLSDRAKVILAKLPVEFAAL